ncbi:Uncharacterised protein [Mycobacteroides abscessus subsp. abscessus]|nr:Uncharacterised protein [Mycobacteroides abscessus subsp. abscessus]SHU75368.1 Uncharacterised protein [Mycobacteroides abscessus subsp. abscessus]SHV91409.1 Uncharacterised protein [Mycobacteroides abscessus subsp. abscessus]SHW94113.1 Uncharacterised protein [Mycobacteroides abscessus subsp. abscessus]SHZ09550.1 Uncharacterised protein [Mycobacteroides abscessus subsp. abscessus]
MLGFGFHVNGRGGANGAHAHGFGSGLVPLPGRNVEPLPLRWRRLGATQVDADVVDQIPPGAPRLRTGHLLFQDSGHKGFPHTIGGAEAHTRAAVDQPGDGVVFGGECFRLVVGAEETGQTVEQPFGTVAVRAADHGFVRTRDRQHPGAIGGVRAPDDGPARGNTIGRVARAAAVDAERSANIQRPRWNPLTDEWSC